MKDMNKEMYHYHRKATKTLAKEKCEREYLKVKERQQLRGELFKIKRRLAVN